jgi:heat shock protein HslJ
MQAKIRTWFALVISTVLVAACSTPAQQATTTSAATSPTAMPATAEPATPIPTETAAASTPGATESMTATAAISATAPITGVEWQLQEIQYMNDTVEKPSDPAQYTLMLNGDGSFSAKVDCNTATGNYTLDGSSLKFGPIATTEAACPPGSLADKYVQGLTDATSFVLKDGDLYIAFGPDAGILHFAPTKAP